MPTDWKKLRQLIERDEILQVIFRFANALDLQDWDLFRSCFSDELYIDYFDLRGEKGKVSAEAYVKQRRTGLIGLKTQHLSFNHQVEIEVDKAVCTSGALILRFDPGRKRRNFFHTHCLYEHRLIRTSGGWRIIKIRQRVLWNEGNLKVHRFDRVQDSKLRKTQRGRSSPG